jgi:hypothetical protein
MSEQNQSFDSAQDIREIKRIMERSSRFISLSGLSGIAAGLSGLAGAYLAKLKIDDYYSRFENRLRYDGADFTNLKLELLAIAGLVLAVALSTALYFTWRRAKQNSIPLWNMTSKKLLWNMLVPLFCGAVFILAMLQNNEWRFVSSACLIFYGLALVNGSKYTLSDIRYLGYLEIVLGLISTQFLGYGLYFWGIGFGLLHIVYGVIMWWKYERK